MKAVLCSRPVIETQHIGDWTLARCTSCSQVSPRGEDADGPWAEAHRAAAVPDEAASCCTCTLALLEGLPYDPGCPLHFAGGHS